MTEPRTHSEVVKRSVTQNANSFDPAGRSALRAAGRLRDRLRELLTLSLEQADAVRRADHDALRELLTRKDALIGELRGNVDETQHRGWNLRRPDSFSGGIACVRILGEAAELSRRLQAHERHIIGKLTVAREQIESRLNRVGQKRRAATGYRASGASGETFNAVR